MNVPGRQRHQTTTAQTKAQGADLRRRAEQNLAPFDRPSPTLGQEDVEGLLYDIRSLALDLDGRERERIDDIAARLRALAQAVRGFAKDLDVPRSEERPLAPAMRRYIQDLSASSGIVIEFRERGVPADCPPSIAHCLFRLLQESLGNVVKHAGAKQAVVTLAGLGSGIEMRVVDDGRGFDLTQVLRTKKGAGLDSIQEGVRWLGGKVVIQSRPGKGAELTVAIPLNTLSPWALPAA
jgi:two-component system sensor histidine kinase UhpB